MRKLFWFVVVILAVTFSGFFGFGMNLPKKHAFTVQGVYAASQAKVWKAISDYKNLPNWSDTVTSTERQHDLEGQPVWRLHAPYGRFMDLHIIDEDPELLHVAEIVDGNYPFSGIWSFRIIKGQDEKILVELTEEGVIESPFWRVVMRHIVGQETGARTFLREMGAYVEAAEPEVVKEAASTAEAAAEEEQKPDSKDAKTEESKAE